jgi:hypothetical protein
MKPGADFLKIFFGETVFIPDPDFKGAGRDFF